jgi:hypothetical protein
VREAAYPDEIAARIELPRREPDAAATARREAGARRDARARPRGGVAHGEIEATTAGELAAVLAMADEPLADRVVLLERAEAA